MWRLFLKHSLRYFARHKGLSLLNIFGVALGVAVFVSVQITNYSALQSFRASVDVVAGRTQLEMVGDGVRFADALYRYAYQHPGIASATPIVEEVALLTDHPEEYVHILGIDVFTNAPFSTFVFRDEGHRTGNAADFIADPRVICLSQPFAKRLGYRIGDTLRLQVQGRSVPFRIGYLLEYQEDLIGADEHLAIMDIASVQESFDLAGRISRVNMRFADGANREQVIGYLRGKVPDNVLVQEPDRRGRQVEQMVSAFQLNLTALSLISLLVGMFLVYNTVAAAVVRRRFEIGVLRALGLSPGQVQMLFLGEAMVLGTLGSILGLSLGVLLAAQLIGTVSKTITSLYVLLSIQELFVSPWAILSGAGLGLGAVALGAWFPSREAANLPPVEALSPGHLELAGEHRTGHWLKWALLLGLIAAILGWVSRWQGPAWLSFGCALFVLLAFAFTVPWCNQQIARWNLLPSILWRLAFQHFGRSLHRNSVTVAALVTALAMLVGVSVMIFSFRTTVDQWLNRSVTADLFIAPVAGLVVGNRETLPPEVEAAVAKIEGIGSMDRYRELRVRVDDRPVKLAVIGFATNAERNPLQLGTKDDSALMRSAAKLGQVLVNESFSRKFQKHVGDTVALASGDGAKSFVIAGVFTDYTTESGLVLLDWDTYRQSWDEDRANSLAIYTAKGTMAAEVQARLKAVLNPLGRYLVYSNAELRTQIFRIFDQTFAVTYVLQTIGICVSGLGICLALTILVAERQREIGVLRAIGAHWEQVGQIVLIEAGLLGLVGSCLGIVAGLVLAAVLTYVINVAFFGWTIQWSVPWGFLASLPPSVILVAVLAGIWPAREAARVEIAQAVKME